jgi:enamine deaminase RidA (YjgF/YER057c/UK114 family)
MMRLDIRAIESSEALELYVSAIPELTAGDPCPDVRQAFDSLYRIVKSYGARICRERVFVPEGCLRTYQAAHQSMIGNQSAPVPTDWLSAGAPGAYGGVQIYAVRGPVDWQPLRAGEETLGWTFRQNGHRWAITGDVHPQQTGNQAQEARLAFETGEFLLRQAGMDLHSVARTWIFLDHILDWYGTFNETRNRLFIDRGLMQRMEQADAVRVPASTGMGVRPASASSVALELFAVSGPEGSVKRYAAAGKQRSAYEYGSAFARAAEAHTPAGRTVFVSGTAAIDDAGATCHVGDIDAQIRMTIDNVLAVLRDTNCSPRSAVQAIAYCKNVEVARRFEQQWAGELDWPWITVIGDVCRDDLLFEAEVTACEVTNE